MMMRGPEHVDWFAAALSALLGLVGRLMSLAHEQRNPLGKELLWEIPAAIGMGVVGRGVGEYVGLSGFPLFSCSICAAYIGPRLISYAVQRWLGS